MVERCLDLSTGHCPSSEPDFGGLTILDYDEGWMVFLDSEVPLERISPDWMLPIIELARQHQVSLIRFDSMSEINTLLEVWDW